MLSKTFTNKNQNIYSFFKMTVSEIFHTKTHYKLQCKVLIKHLNILSQLKSILEKKRNYLHPPRAAAKKTTKRLAGNTRSPAVCGAREEPSCPPPATPPTRLPARTARSPQMSARDRDPSRAGNGATPSTGRNGPPGDTPGAEPLVAGLIFFRRGWG